MLANLAEIGVQASPPDMVGWRVHAPSGDGTVDLVQADEYALCSGGWRAWVCLDGSRPRSSRVQVYALWDLVVLSDGRWERRADLLAEAG